MDESSKKECGVLLVLVERFKKQKLPRLKTIKTKVDNGNLLSDMDIDFLERVIDDANRTMPLSYGHPDLHEFCAYVVNYYEKITKKALENEKK